MLDKKHLQGDNITKEDLDAICPDGELQIQDTADLPRFTPLGVIANYTPWWHSDDVEVYKRLFGEERSKKLYRCKSVWDRR